MKEEDKKAEIVKQRRKRVADFAIVVVVVCCCVGICHTLKFAFCDNFQENINRGIWKTSWLRKKWKLGLQD